MLFSNINSKKTLYITHSTQSSTNSSDTFPSSSWKSMPPKVNTRTTKKKHCWPNAKCSKKSALYEWFVWHQKLVNMSGGSLKEKENIFLRQLYPDAASFEFNGRLEKFKQWLAIHSFNHFRRACWQSQVQRSATTLKNKSLYQTTLDEYFTLC